MMYAIDEFRVKNFQTSQVTVGTSATALRSSDESERKPFQVIKLKKIGTANVFIGNADTVTTDNGYPLEDEMVLFLPKGNQIYAIADAAGSKVALMECELELY